jgi:methyltransferase
MPVLLPLVTLAVIAVMMLAELKRSRTNERILRATGAVEPSGDVYRQMQWAYPAAFVVMIVEGLIAGPPPRPVTIAGIALLVFAKALKYWAIASLGTRWTFRVLVPPEAARVVHGPYAFVRHPNYIAVVGELASVAMIVGARLTGPVVTFLFALLIRHRIRVENRALRYPPCT